MQKRIYGFDFKPYINDLGEEDTKAAYFIAKYKA